MGKIKKIIKNPYLLLLPLFGSGFFNFLPDKKYISLVYKSIFGQKINWDNPKTYNEKLQWIKIYDRRELYVKLVDKKAVRDYVSSIIGEEYLVPLIGCWETVDDIDFEHLPNKFVLKCNHDSGSIVICTDKKRLM